MDINLIVNVCSKAWALPILAAMGDGVPGRQAALLNATGAGRSSFASSVTHLIDLGLVRRRGGHGHPLRPEFELTEDQETWLEWMLANRVQHVRLVVE